MSLDYSDDESICCSKCEKSKLKKNIKKNIKKIIKNMVYDKLNTSVDNYQDDDEETECESNKDFQLQLFEQFNKYATYTVCVNVLLNLGVMFSLFLK